MLLILSGGFWKRLYLMSAMTLLFSLIFAGMPTRVQQEYGIDPSTSKEVKEPVLPKHTLIIVNKRVRQRFFQMGTNAGIANPPQGTYVDNGFVE